MKCAGRINRIEQDSGSHSVNFVNSVFLSVCTLFSVSAQSEPAAQPFDKTQLTRLLDAPLLFVKRHSFTNLHIWRLSEDGNRVFTAHKSFRAGVEVLKEQIGWSAKVAEEGEITADGPDLEPVE